MEAVTRRMANLVIAKPRLGVNMQSVIRAAQLFHQGKTGNDAFCAADRDGWMYAFVPTGGISVTTIMREATLVLFGPTAMLCARDNQFLPYLLTRLCSDLLSDETAQWVQYSSEYCSFASSNKHLQIELKKHIDYCSYHDVTLSFTGTKWALAIKGCWRGKEGDSGGGVYHPPGNSYSGCVRGSGRLITSHKLSGYEPEKGFKLWGIDLAKLGIKVPKKKAA